jgi:hypothetical protein
MKTPVKIALAVVFIVAVGGILAALYLYNLKAKDLKKVKPDFVVTSTDFQKAFEENEKNASVKYINKVIEVKGEIIAIEGTDKKTWNVTLQTASDMSKVICTFPKVANPEVFALGKEVTIRGVCSGVLSDILLNNCALIEAPK